jgi:hypothetical protein
MGTILTVTMLLVLIAVLVLLVDSMAMQWVEGGQPDPFSDLDEVSLARLRG